MSVVVVVAQTFHVRDGDVHECAHHVHEQLSELCHAGQTGIWAAEVDVDPAASTAALEITVEADDQPSAIDQALTVMRRAIQAASDASPAWPTGPDLDRLMQSVERTLTVERLCMAI
ncbi:MAG TPA: hypothetical protein VFE65_06240 [Pseudonocardia sp.]|jgi:hypothetical protein|nr:hypothetical protein [Pseudonocardia sp.]